LESQSPIRPCLMCSGCQSSASLAASSSSRSLVVAMYQAGLA